MGVGKSPGKGASPVMPHQDALVMAQGSHGLLHVIHQNLQLVILTPLHMPLQMFFTEVYIAGKCCWDVKIVAGNGMGLWMARFLGQAGLPDIPP